MNSYLKTLASYVVIPYPVGVVIGLLYPMTNPESKKNIVDGIASLGNPLFFDLLALTSVAIVSVYVLVKGPIRRTAGKYEKALLYWPPTIASGYAAPFFAGLFGFITGHPESEPLRLLGIYGIIGLVWSVGLLVLVLAPAHEGVWPREYAEKKMIYSAALLSFAAVAVWRYLL